MRARDAGPTGLKIKSRKWFTTQRLGPSTPPVSPSGFFGFCFKREHTHPPIEWTSSPPLVAAVLMAPQGAESPGSSHVGVIGALIFFLI